MKRLALALALVLLAGTASFVVPAPGGDKVPKCSKRLCQDVGCDPTFYCASGAHVVSCADICNHG